MTKGHWLQSAITNDVMVADLLLRLKHSSASGPGSSRARRIPVTQKPIKISTLLLPPRWGYRKNRSKSAVKEHRGSPTTHLSWSGGGGSTSDAPSDLSSGSRSVKVNEIGSISSQHHRKKMKKMGEERGFVLPDLNMIPIEEEEEDMI
ncbi:uncharacterized protein LOC143637646 [Bidens hawaiensis]|uniref:uncharacterized protein LOC143637646 n=1 Tax=Bidens hawaiensis TaxID=980011 RepID=UPI00404B80BF